MSSARNLDQTSRDQFNVALSCAGCGQAGFARWEENGPNHKGPQRMLVGLSAGFRHEPKQPQKSGDPAIYCVRCNTVQSD
jgi:hypothetical protein